MTVDRGFWIPNMRISDSEYVKIYSVDDLLMINDTTRKLLKKTPSEILAECGQTDKVPVDLGVILRHYGISVFGYDFSDIEKTEGLKESVSRRGRILGAVIANKDSTAIFYSNDEDLMTDHRYRFTVAHELGHCCFGESNHIEFRHDGETSDRNEIVANVFAGELLIPYEQLKRISEELLIPSIKNFAAIFEVSETVMAARLAYLRQNGLSIKYV